MTQPADQERPEDQATQPDAGTPSTQEGAPAPAQPAQDQQAGDQSAEAAEGSERAEGAEQGVGEGDEQFDVDLAAAREDVAALTGDLQRLQAEYLNYKRRVERDRQLIAENAAYKALTPIVEVLDAIDRAREAGDVEGGFKAVAEHLERAVAQSGLVRFGEPGDPFDPNLHDALSHLGEDPEVSVTTVKVVAKAGYRMGERIVRAAQVLVVEPASGAAAGAADEQGGSSQQ